MAGEVVVVPPCRRCTNRLLGDRPRVAGMRLRGPWSSKQRDAERGAERDAEGWRIGMRREDGVGCWGFVAGPVVAFAAVFVCYGRDKDALRWVAPFLLFLAFFCDSLSLPHRVHDSILPRNIPHILPATGGLSHGPC
jgi:hypothetical protein